MASPLNLHIYGRGTDREDGAPLSDAAIQLDDIGLSVSLLAKGLSGRFCSAEPLATAPDFLANPHRIFPFSNGRTIYLPDVLDVFPLREAHRRIIRLYTAVQAGQWELGSFERPRDVDVRTIWKDPYRPVESDHLFWIRFFMGRFPDAGLAGNIFITLETARVAAGMARRFRGFAAELQWFLPCLADRSIHAVHLRGVLWNLFFHLFDCSVTTGAGNIYAPMIAAARPLVRDSASLKDTMRVTVALYGMLAPLMKSLSREDKLEFEGEHDSFLANLPGRERRGSKKVEREDGNGDYATFHERMMEFIENLTFRNIRTARDAMNFMTEELAERFRKESTEEGEPYRKQGPTTRSMFDDAHHGVTPLLYPEWDYLLRSYRQNWISLYPLDTLPAGGASGRPVLEGWETLVRDVMKQFRMLSREDRIWRKRLLHGEEIEFDRMVEVDIDRRRGDTPTDKIYMEKRRRVREVSTFLLLDMSASTSFKIEEGGHRGETVLSILLAGAAIMSQALEQLGDRCCICGFSGYGKNNVELWHIKPFTAHLDDGVLQDMGRLRPQRSTRMGAAVRHACHVLASEQAALRLLLVLSDGYPQDCDYGDDRSDSEYGLRDTARALAEAEMNGIIPFCISVDAAGHDYLRRMCPPHTYLVMKKIQDLPRELPKLYMRLRSQ